MPYYERKLIDNYVLQSESFFDRTAYGDTVSRLSYSSRAWTQLFLAELPIQCSWLVKAVQLRIDFMQQAMIIWKFDDLFECALYLCIGTLAVLRFWLLWLGFTNHFICIIWIDHLHGSKQLYAFSLNCFPHWYFTYLWYDLIPRNAKTYAIYQISYYISHSYSSLWSPN